MGLRGKVLLGLSVALILSACSSDNTDLKYEKEVKQRGLEALRAAASTKTKMKIGKLFGAKAPIFCVTVTVPQSEALTHNSRPEFHGVFGSLLEYAEQNPGDPSLESTRLFFASMTGVQWSAEVYPGVYNLHFSGPLGCYRLSDVVDIENVDPAGPLVVTFPIANS